MPPCKVEILACGSCEHINASEQQDSPKGKRPAEGAECSDQGGAIKSKFGEHAVPYKKRKVKKSVKFSPASVYRVVECVPGEWCEDSDEDLCEAPTGARAAVGAVAAKDEETSDLSGPLSDELALDSAPASPAHVFALAAEMAASPRTPSVLHEKKISTKDGDGPSTIGLICNALIMGLVDRSITNAETAIDAMRQVIKAAAGAGNEHPTSCPSSPTGASAPPGDDDCNDSNTPICEHVFQSVLARLQQLVEHLDRHERVGLLPSTARLGKPFIPALKCLQGTLQLAMERLAAGDEEDADEREVEEDVEESHVVTPTTPDSFKENESYLA